MKKKHLLLSIILLCILFSLTACGRQNSGNSSTSDGNTQLSGKHHVAIEVNNYGTIEVELMQILPQLLLLILLILPIQDFITV